MTDNQPAIQLRKTEHADLDILFQFLLDKESNNLAAFTTKNATDKTTYVTKYTKLLNDPVINHCTILLNNTIVGSIAKFNRENDSELTYLIDRSRWGKGIATEALRQFLKTEPVRPIYGRTAFDNIGSQKVLEKCGFTKIGTGKYFANARQSEIEEFIYRLDNSLTE